MTSPFYVMLGKSEEVRGGKRFARLHGRSYLTYRFGDGGARERNSTIVIMLSLIVAASARAPLAINWRVFAKGDAGRQQFRRSGYKAGIRSHVRAPATIRDVGDLRAAMRALSNDGVAFHVMDAPRPRRVLRLAHGILADPSPVFWSVSVRGNSVMVAGGSSRSISISSRSRQLSQTQISRNPAKLWRGSGM